MNQFNNEEYKKLVSDIVGDAFYSNASARAKISTVRGYAEVIVRRITNADPQEKIMLGDRKTRDKIQSMPNHEFLERAVEILRNEGNKASHSQYLDKMSLRDFEDVVEALFDLMSYLLINYFDKYEFGSNGKIIVAFSLLPPIIRYKVLKYLHDKYPENVFIVDKLTLAMTKAFDTETALEWIENNKDDLSQLDDQPQMAINASEYSQLYLAYLNMGIGLQSMYQVCKERVISVGEDIKHKGRMYSDFESALPYYKKVGGVEGDSPEIREFNDIMEFLYMGRKEREKLCSSINMT